MHPLTKILWENNEDSLFGPNGADVIIIGWLEEKMSELFHCNLLALGGERKIREILGLERQTLEEKIEDWFDAHNYAYPSSKEWHKAMRKEIPEIARRHYEENPGGT